MAAFSAFGCSCAASEWYVDLRNGNGTDLSLLQFIV
jgi:hypothetical protein